MKKFIQSINGFFSKSHAPEHKHDWKYQYSTGNANDGKSQVSKCECGKWAVRHYGKSEMTILKD